jgi:hypothetical protein
VKRELVKAIAAAILACALPARTAGAAERIVLYEHFTSPY